MSFADSWHWASCALLLLTLHFSMFSFYPPLSFSLSLAFSFSLSLFLSLSLYLCTLFLSVVARHMSSDALYQIFSSWSILLFHTISFHSSYKIHQLFTDYLLRLPSSELLEKHLFRSRANRRLVIYVYKMSSMDRLSRPRQEQLQPAAWSPAAPLHFAAASLSDWCWPSLGRRKRMLMLQDRSCNVKVYIYILCRY